MLANFEGQIVLVNGLLSYKKKNSVTQEQLRECMKFYWESYLYMSE